MQPSAVPAAKAPFCPSSWKVVEARVLVSLSPAELCSPRARANATRRALSGLLMRHQPALGGVVVAHRGGLRFPDSACARLLGASPFAHISADVTLLVFAPRRGDRLRARVAHVGPDHVGLTLWNTFHVVLPLAEMGDRFVYDHRRHRWRNSECPDGAQDIRLDATVLFGVAGLRHTHSGLFHVAATLLDINGDACTDLGVVNDDLADEPGDRFPSDVVVPASSFVGDASGDEDVHVDGDILEASVLRMTPGHRVAMSNLHVSNEMHDANFDDALARGPKIVLPKQASSSITKKKKAKKKKKEKEKSLTIKKVESVNKKEPRKLKGQARPIPAPGFVPIPPKHDQTSLAGKIEDEVFVEDQVFGSSSDVQAKLEPKLEDVPEEYFVLHGHEDCSVPQVNGDCFVPLVNEECLVPPVNADACASAVGLCPATQSAAIGSVKEGAISQKRKKGKKANDKKGNGKKQKGDTGNGKKQKGLKR